MRAVKTRLKRLEFRANPVQQPRLIVLNPGEEKGQALTRLGISRDQLALEQQSGRKIIWVRWAG